jgi:uncharacterized protein (TIGR03083 family)
MPGTRNRRAVEENAALAEKLNLEGEKLGSYLAALGAEDWKTEVYSEGAAWNIRSIVAHLLTTELALLKLFEQVRQGGPGVSDDFVIDRYNASQQRKTAHLEPAEILQAFRAARSRMADFVLQLGQQDFEKEGRHPFLGVTTLREMIKMVYIHNQTHYRDIRRALGAHQASQ